MEHQTIAPAGGAVMPLLKCLLASYVLTALLLLALSCALWKLGLGEQPVRIAVIVIYVAATMAGGWLAGKALQTRRLLWGLLLGIAYFVVLAVMSLVVNGDASALGESFVTVLALCAGGGMLGSIVS